MNDNQKKMMVSVNFLNGLMDKVESGEISFGKMQELIKAMLNSIEETDMSEGILQKARDIIAKEKLDINITAEIANYK